MFTLIVNLTQPRFTWEESKAPSYCEDLFVLGWPVGAFSGWMVIDVKTTQPTVGDTIPKVVAFELNESREIELSIAKQADVHVYAFISLCS